MVAAEIRTANETRRGGAWRSGGRRRPRAADEIASRPGSHEVRGTRPPRRRCVGRAGNASVRGPGRCGYTPRSPVPGSALRTRGPAGATTRTRPRGAGRRPATLPGASRTAGLTLRRVDVVVAGGHGQIALRLLRLLAERGDTARGLIRNPDHAGRPRGGGGRGGGVRPRARGRPRAVRRGRRRGGVRGRRRTRQRRGAQADHGPRRRGQADRGRASAGIARYVIVSSIGADDPEPRLGADAPLLEAKADADHALAASGLDYTIVRPGGLTNDPGTGAWRGRPRLRRRGPPRRRGGRCSPRCWTRRRHRAARPSTLIGGDDADRRGRARALSRGLDLEAPAPSEVLAPRALVPPGRGHHLRRPVARRPALRRARCSPRATTRASRGSAWCAPTARWPRASASAGCSRRRACRSAASAWTCAQPGLRRTRVVELPAMAYETLLYDVRDDGVATITLERARHPQRALRRAAGRADRRLRGGARRRARALRRAHLHAREGLQRRRQPRPVRRRRAARAQALRHRALPAAVHADRAARQAHDLRGQRPRAGRRARDRARLRPDRGQGQRHASARPRSTWACSRS